jgi:hypothetical protein
MPTTQLPRDPKGCLRWLLQFEAQPIGVFRQPGKDEMGRDVLLSDPEPSVMAAAQAGVEHFIAAAQRRRPSHSSSTKPLTGDQFRAIHSMLRYSLPEIAKGGAWNIPASELSDDFGFVAGAGWADYYGDTHDQFLLTFVDLMRREGKLIAKCARDGCGTLFLRAGRARYCGKRCSKLVEAKQARKHRERFSPEQKTQLRRSYYLARLKRLDPAHWRHLRDAALSVAKAISGANTARRKSR